MWYKYLRASYQSEKFKRKSRSMNNDNQYLTIKVKVMETKMGVLERNLVSMETGPSEIVETIHILKEKNKSGP
jgi:hypothetical protein